MNHPMVEKNPKKTKTQSDYLSDSNSLEEEISLHLRTSPEERLYDSIKGSAQAAQAALAHTKAQCNPTVERGLVQGANYARCFLPELCKPLPVSLFRNLCETVAYGACAVLWGMFVRGCARRDLC